MFLDDNQLNYVIRVKKNRKVIHNKKIKSIDNVVLKSKGKYNYKFYKDNEQIDCKISHTKIKLNGFKKDHSLVVIYGFGNSPIKLVTNRIVNSKSDLNNIVRDYFCRWRIEEYFKFRKTQYDFENIRVRSLKSLRLINQILSYVISFISLIRIKESRIKNITIKEGKSKDKVLKNRTMFLLYQISFGLKKILRNISFEINQIIKVKKAKVKRDRNLFSIFQTPGF